MQALSLKQSGPARCLHCRNRAWRQLSGFMVMSCRVHGWRFGLKPDLQRGHVNREGACVPLPRECKDYEHDPCSQERHQAFF